MTARTSTLAWQVIRDRDGACLATYANRDLAEEHGSRLMREHLNDTEAVFYWTCFACDDNDSLCNDCATTDGNPASLRPMRRYSYVDDQQEYGYELRPLLILNEAVSA